MSCSHLLLHHCYQWCRWYTFRVLIPVSLIPVSLIPASNEIRWGKLFFSIGLFHLDFDESKKKTELVDAKSAMVYLPVVFRHSRLSATSSHRLPRIMPPPHLLSCPLTHLIAHPLTSSHVRGYEMRWGSVDRPSHAASSAADTIR
jgi:hypothetical protein